VLAWVVVAHLFLTSLITLVLLSSTSTPLPPTTSILISYWATFLGLTSALLAIIQYAPQIVHTYNLGLVGALSIPMMCMQTPGAVGMVLSIALRPGTNWTSWITFAVAGVMQGSLLVMCIAWKLRQRRLGLDDFGHSLSLTESNANTGTSDLATHAPLLAVVDIAAVDGELGVDGTGEEIPLLGGKKDGGRRRRWRRWFRG